jgi:Tfp pilus assembly protein PilE
MGLIRHHPDRTATAADGERGAMLILVMGVLLFASVLVLAVLSFLRSYVASASAFQARTDRTQANADAVQYALNIERNNQNLGRYGTATNTTTWTYNSITVTCVGQPGSGAPQNSGYTDRLVVCSTPVISAEIRYFDRGGAGNGVVAELISWQVLT